MKTKRWRACDILLVRPRVVVEHVEERLDVDLREDAGCVQQRVWHLRVVGWRLNGIPRYIVLRPTWRGPLANGYMMWRLIVNALTSLCPAAVACWSSCPGEACALGRGLTSGGALGGDAIISIFHATANKGSRRRDTHPSASRSRMTSPGLTTNPGTRSAAGAASALGSERVPQREGVQPPPREPALSAPCCSGTRREGTGAVGAVAGRDVVVVMSLQMLQMLRVPSRGTLGLVSVVVRASELPVLVLRATRHR